jgi:hypothetical protein
MTQAVAPKFQAYCDKLRNNMDRRTTTTTTTSTTTTTTKRKKEAVATTNDTEEEPNLKRVRPIYRDDDDDDDMETLVSAPARRLTRVMTELAKLLATAKRHAKGWAYIESKASDKLQAYMAQTQMEHDEYFLNPIQCLIPKELMDSFTKYVARMEKAVDDDDDNFSEPRRARTKSSFSEDRALGQSFAQERRDKLCAFVQSLRDGLRAYQQEELAVWDHFVTNGENHG